MLQLFKRLALLPSSSEHNQWIIRLAEEQLKTGQTFFSHFSLTTFVDQFVSSHQHSVEMCCGMSKTEVRTLLPSLPWLTICRQLRKLLSAVYEAHTFD
jgi:hypothetical protein